MKKVCLFLTAILAMASLQAQPFTLLKDINSQPSTSTPELLTPFGNSIYFVAEHPASGYELWKSDGSASGTVMVKDIYPGKDLIAPLNLYPVGSILFFTADDGIHGRELWKTDGTAAGTVMIKDIINGADGIQVEAVASLGNTLFFVIDDGVNGVELWKSDGTEPGTVLVKDIAPGTAGSNPFNLLSTGSVLFFQASDGVTGKELWKTDGTEPGTVMVKDINPGAGHSSPEYLTEFGSDIYFRVTPNINDAELWKSDGTEAGTVLVKNGFQAANGEAWNFKVAGSILFFSAVEATYGKELWKTDGTTGGTILVKDIAPGEDFWGSPSYMTTIGSTLYFIASVPGSGNEIWKSDGTEAGTLNIGGPGPIGFEPNFLTSVGSSLFFAAFDGEGWELWTSDGSSFGTMVRDIYPGMDDVGVQQLTPVGSEIYFVASNEVNGRELWKSNGTEAGTVMVRDIFVSDASAPTFLTPLGSELFFSARVGLIDHLWKTNGTESGTVSLSDEISNPYFGWPANIVSAGTHVYFSAFDNDGTSLWRSDGTPAGTSLVKYPSFGTSGDALSHMTMVGPTLFFVAEHPLMGMELWKSDGTDAGTIVVKDIVPGDGGIFVTQASAVGPVLYFNADNSLWKSDGTEAGTVQISAPGLLVGEFHAVGSVVYFEVTNAGNGVELWRTDGTPAGTTMVREIYAGNFAGIYSYISMGSTLYFLAKNDLSHQLWKSDGSFAGTVPVSSINMQPSYQNDPLDQNYNNAADLMTLDGWLYFINSDADGMELWKTDGTVTTKVKDINPGSGSGAVIMLGTADGKLFFTGNDGIYGAELWMTDGSEGGTVMVQDLLPGVGSSSPWNFINVNGTYYVSANSNYGVELFVTAGTPLPLKLLAFTGRLQQNTGILEWRTAGEMDTKNFTLQRSIDRRNYTDIANVEAAGTGDNDYQFTDAEIKNLGATVVYYRLKMIDMDESFTYSHIVPLRLKGNGGVAMIYPNPAKDRAVLQVNSDKREKAVLVLNAASGQILLQKQIVLEKGMNNVVLDLAAYATGVYHVVIKGEWTDQKLPLIKQ